MIEGDFVGLIAPSRLFCLGLNYAALFVGVRLVALTGRGAHPCAYSPKQAAEEMQMPRGTFVRALRDLKAAKVIATTYDAKTRRNYYILQEAGEWIQFGKDAGADLTQNGSESKRIRLKMDQTQNESESKRVSIRLIMSQYQTHNESGCTPLAQTGQGIAESPDGSIWNNDGVVVSSKALTHVESGSKNEKKTASEPTKPANTADHSIDLGIFGPLPALQQAHQMQSQPLPPAAEVDPQTQEVINALKTLVATATPETRQSLTNFDPGLMAAEIMAHYRAQGMRDKFGNPVNLQKAAISWFNRRQQNGGFKDRSNLSGLEALARKPANGYTKRRNGGPMTDEERQAQIQRLMAKHHAEMQARAEAEAIEPDFYVENPAPSETKNGTR